MHATAFLKQPDKSKPGAFVVLHGSETHLKQAALQALARLILGSAEDQLGLARFAGKDAEFRSVRDDLLTVSMFTPKKIVVVDDADDFISEYRASLEDYVDKPAKGSLLILNCKSWRKNTKLAKKLDKAGLEIECSELTGAKLTEWLVEQAQSVHGKQLTREAAGLIPTLAGSSLGLLDQELQKLAAYVGDKPKIGVEEVRKLVGGWKGETTWTMINAIRDGIPDVALGCLDKLMTAGEAPQKILGGMNFVFRKFALATERSRQGMPLKAALESSGVFKWEVDAGEKYLRRIKRQRAERLLERLLEADYGLKGGSRVPEKLQLEQLVLWLAGSIPV